MNALPPLNDSRAAPVMVVGAGAAGLLAALSATRGPRPVLLLEGSARPGRKILISGGGRCNVLPSQAAPADFVSEASPHLLRKILAAWPLPAVRRFFEDELGLPLRLEPATGKLFPVADQARPVLDALLAAFSRRGGTLRLEARVVGLEPSDGGWRVQLASGEELIAARVVLATGGLAAPATGSDGGGLRLVAALGHTLVPSYPALVPLMGSNLAHRELAGVSLNVTLWGADAARAGVKASGGFLFTHRGYSGPVVLNLSHTITRALARGEPIPALHVQWTDLNAEAWDAELRAAPGPLLPRLHRHLPERLGAQLLAEVGLSEAVGAQLRREARARLIAALTRYPLPVDGSEGYRTAEVTGGGVALEEVNPATLESRRAPGLHLCGEMLDAFGPIGGYNFLWAWVTGRIAGLGCAAG